MLGAFLPEWIGAGAALAILFAISWIQIRHVGLAAAAAFAPLPGYLAAAALHIALHPLGYLSGFLGASLLLSAVETQICDTASPAEAVRRALRSASAVIVWPLLLAIAVAGSSQPMLALLVFLTGASALGGAVLAARFLRYDDEFIVRANRLRERRERWLDGLAFTVQPRWGWSISGITLIFAVVGCFQGGRAMPLFPAAVLIAEASLMAIVAIVAIRNIRCTLAFLLAAGSLVSMAVWIWDRLPSGAPDLVLASTIAVAPVLVMAIQTAGFARRGDTITVASLRASEQSAIPMAFFCLAASVALAVQGALSVGIFIFLGGAAAFIVFPAITTAVHQLFPLPVSQDAYRIR